MIEDLMNNSAILKGIEYNEKVEITHLTDF